MISFFNRQHHFYLTILLFSAGTVTALASPVTPDIPADSVKESNIDYPEKIYFSQKNKAELLKDIILTLTTLQPGVADQSLTASQAAQYTFLNGIKAKAETAENPCTITDMLAAGIHSFDEAEAIAQNIPRPSTQVTATLGQHYSKHHEFVIQRIRPRVECICPE